MSVNLHGYCHPRFRRVQEEFERNFAERGEVGAAVCVMIEGETVVDLWGGLADPQTQRPWDKDTVVVVWSCTKGATALCAHILASRGELNLDLPVAYYWPEFAQAGKGEITVSMLLNHQAGLPVFRKKLPEGAYTRWEVMIRALEEQEPFWQPGTRHGYHAFTFGWLVGEVIRRVSGRSLGRFFQEEVAGPLGLDFWIGLPEEMEPRVAPLIMREESREAAARQRTEMQSLVGNVGGFVQEVNTRRAHAAEVGAAGGITNARALAKMYAPLACGGGLGEVALVDKVTLARMSSVSSAVERDAILDIPTRFTLGFQKSSPGIGLSEDAFGHTGSGGSIGFASPKNRLSFGYVMNRMGDAERRQALMDAVYQSLGYTSHAAGFWIR